MPSRIYDDNRYEEAIEEIKPIPVAESDAGILSRVADQLGDGLLATSERFGDPSVTVSADALHGLMTWLQADGFVLLSDLTAWDDHPRTDPRFWVIYQLTNVTSREILTVRVGLPEKKPEIASVTDIWPGANFLEREVYDLMGITFKNHPNLKRIMMPEEWEGHPLRRDYPAIYEEVQFTHNFDEIQRRKPYATE